VQQSDANALFEAMRTTFVAHHAQDKVARDLVKRAK